MSNTDSHSLPSEMMIQPIAMPHKAKQIESCSTTFPESLFARQKGKEACSNKNTSRCPQKDTCPHLSRSSSQGTGCVCDEQNRKQKEENKNIGLLISNRQLIQRHALRGERWPLPKLGDAQLPGPNVAAHLWAFPHPWCSCLAEHCLGQALTIAPARKSNKRLHPFARPMAEGFGFDGKAYFTG